MHVEMTIDLLVTTMIYYNGFAYFIYYYPNIKYRGNRELLCTCLCILCLVKWQIGWYHVTSQYRLPPWLVFVTSYHPRLRFVSLDATLTWFYYPDFCLFYSTYLFGRHILLLKLLQVIRVLCRLLLYIILFAKGAPTRVSDIFMPMHQ